MTFSSMPFSYLKCDPFYVQLFNHIAKQTHFEESEPKVFYDVSLSSYVATVCTKGFMY